MRGERLQPCSRQTEFPTRTLRSIGAGITGGEGLFEAVAPCCPATSFLSPG